MDERSLGELFYLTIDELGSIKTLSQIHFIRQ